MRKQTTMTYISRRLISLWLTAAFIVGPLPRAQAQDFTLPKPGVMVHLSPEFTPAHLQGMTIHPGNALQFDFLIHKGDKNLQADQKKEEYKKLIKYFLASLTIPDEDQWVNLSPYEKDRIIKDDFGKTEMGRDLLAQDYLLKQITSSLIYPEDSLGQKFWDKIYERAWKEYHTTNIPVNTFNKVWIVPDEAIVYESGNSAYILKSHLKVMLEEDYLSLEKHSGVMANHKGVKQFFKSEKIAPSPSAPRNDTSSLGSQVVREIVLPALEKEVNEGENFSNLRQMYSGMVLATWYKKALKESLLGKFYTDKAKVKGVNQDPQNNQAIYQQYLKAFKKGCFNYIKEDVDKYTKESVPRKYFSGGFHRPMFRNGSEVTFIPAGKLNRTLAMAAIVSSQESLEQATVAFNAAGEIRNSAQSAGDQAMMENPPKDSNAGRETLTLEALERIMSSYIQSNEKSIYGFIQTLIHSVGGEANITADPKGIEQGATISFAFSFRRNIELSGKTYSALEVSTFILTELERKLNEEYGRNYKVESHIIDNHERELHDDRNFQLVVDIDRRTFEKAKMRYKQLMSFSDILSRIDEIPRTARPNILFMVPRDGNSPIYLMLQNTGRYIFFDHVTAFSVFNEELYYSYLDPQEQGNVIFVCLNAKGVIRQLRPNEVPKSLREEFGIQESDLMDLNGNYKASFIIGGFNDNNVIDSLTQLKGVKMEDVENKMKETSQTDAKSIKDLLKDQNTKVTKRGFTHQEIAEALFIAMQNIPGKYFKIANYDFLIEKSTSDSNKDPVFINPNNFLSPDARKVQYTLRNISLDRSITFFASTAYDIANFGFYGDLDPLNMIEVLGLKPVGRDTGSSEDQPNIIDGKARINPDARMPDIKKKMRASNEELERYHAGITAALTAVVKINLGKDDIGETKIINFGSTSRDTHIDNFSNEGLDIDYLIQFSTEDELKLFRRNLKTFGFSAAKVIFQDKGFEFAQGQRGLTPEGQYLQSFYVREKGQKIWILLHVKFAVTKKDLIYIDWFDRQMTQIENLGESREQIAREIRKMKSVIQDMRKGKTYKRRAISIAFEQLVIQSAGASDYGRTILGVGSFQKAIDRVYEAGYDKLNKRVIPLQEVQDTFQIFDPEKRTNYIATFTVQEWNDLVNLVIKIKETPDFLKEIIVGNPGNLTDSNKAMTAKGGVDFNSANLNLQIKRDGRGVPLPLAQQDMAQLNAIEGFEVNILEIKPAVNVSIISELKTIAK